MGGYFVCKNGSPGRVRTADTVINSHLLYQLSYRGIISIILNRDQGKLSSDFSGMMQERIISIFGAGQVLHFLSICPIKRQALCLVRAWRNW
jgi:hypothetical protein